MKISKEQIQYICEKVVRQFKEQNLINFKAEEQKVINRMIQAFEQNLQQEAQIDQEVNKLLLQHQREIESGAMSRNKLFIMMKKKLAKEKGFIL